MWSLLLLGVAALLISVAGVVQDMAMTVGLACAGSVLLAVFLVVDRRVSASVLPPSVFGAGPLKWVYATLGVLMAGTMVDMYVPLFGQRLAHLTPVAAGFLGAGLAVGWTVAEISSAFLSRDRMIRRVTAIAPVVMAAGLALVRAARGDRRMQESLAREYHFTWRATEQADFIEGVRAQLIDKDRNPNWTADASPEQVEALLAPLGEHELHWEEQV